MKYKAGDKVLYYGAAAIINEVKMGGYLIDFEKSKRKFVYESELSGLTELEDDRGKNRSVDS